MNVTWIGKYWDFDEKGSETEFMFRIDVVMNEDQSFTGTAWEEEFYALSGRFIQVDGFIEDEHISFIKTYPVEYIIDENNRPLINEDKPGHQVVYDGYWDKKGNSWKGTWEVEISTEQLSHEYDEVKYWEGHFEMRVHEG